MDDKIEKGQLLYTLLQESEGEFELMPWKYV